MVLITIVLITLVLIIMLLITMLLITTVLITMLLMLRWWYDRSECKKEKETAAKSELSLSHVAGIFYILISGLVFAIILGVFEFRCFRTMNGKVGYDFTSREYLRPFT